MSLLQCIRLLIYSYIFPGLAIESMLSDSSKTRITMLMTTSLSICLLTSTSIGSYNMSLIILASASEDKNDGSRLLHFSYFTPTAVAPQPAVVIDNSSINNEPQNNSNGNIYTNTAYPSVLPNPVGSSGHVRVSVNYTSNIGIANISISIKGPSMGVTDPRLVPPTVGSSSMSLVKGTMQEGTWSGTFTFPTDIPDGTYSYSLIVTDSLGNKRTDGPFSGIILDRLEEETETTIISAVDGTGKKIEDNGTTFSRNMSFTFEGKSNTGVVLFMQCNLDDIVVPSGMEHGAEENMTTYFTCLVPDKIARQVTANHTYTNLGVGNHTFKVRVVDNEYNIDSAPAAFQWTILPVS
jgi:hypothetical protein